MLQGHIVMKRHSGRDIDCLRPIEIICGYSKYAEGSCLYKSGDTHVLCNATLEEKIPVWLRGQHKGWVTAEYSMLPRSTQERTRREISTGRPAGRTQEIQRLISRSLRGIINLSDIAGYQIIVDCDVIQADGGTRTAAINGSWVSLYLCLNWMKNKGIIRNIPINEQVAAVSCGVFEQNILLDLDYIEDSRADCDVNVVMTSQEKFIEIQGTAENSAFDKNTLDNIINIAQKGIREIIDAQKKAVQDIR